MDLRDLDGLRAAIAAAEHEIPLSIGRGARFSESLSNLIPSGSGRPREPHPTLGLDQLYGI